MAKKILLRSAQRADVIAFRGEPFDQSFRGIVADKEGEIIAIAGVLHTDHLQAFSSIKEPMRKSPKSLILGARIFREILNSYGREIYAFASEKENNSAVFLEYIGFKHYHGRIYLWPT
jgi:predicted transcriptional regulator